MSIVYYPAYSFTPFILWFSSTNGINASFRCPTGRELSFLKYSSVSRSFARRARARKEIYRHIYVKQQSIVKTSLRCSSTELYMNLKKCFQWSYLSFNGKHYYAYYWNRRKASTFPTGECLSLKFYVNEFWQGSTVRKRSQTETNGSNVYFCNE